jgi:CpeT/CpcT family (DUF1001)
MNAIDVTGNRLRLGAAVVLVLSIGGCAAGGGRSGPAPRPLEAELAEILALLPGRYEGPASGGRLFHKIVPLTAPNFGAESVFYHQISRDGFDSSAPFQQKIYVFDRDPARGDNRMRSWVFFPKQGYANLERDPAAMRALQPAQLMNFPLDCAIRWARGDAPGRFVARVRREDCTYDSAGFKQKISPDMTYVLDGESFALEDILYGENGQPLFPPAGLLRAARQAP